MNNASNESVKIINTSAQPSVYEFKFVSELRGNTTDVFLYGTNSYLYNITNVKDQITGLITNYTVNTENGARLLLTYPLFASAIDEWDSYASADSIPPGGGGISVDNVANHSWIQLPGTSGNDILQAWFNVSLVWDYNGTGSPQVINLWMNGTSEAAANYSDHAWAETIFNMGPSPYTWWGWAIVYGDGEYYMEPVGSPADWWVFASEVTNEQHQVPS